MYIDVDLGHEPAVTRLLEPHDFMAFKMIVHGDDEADALDAALGHLGSVDANGNHAWLTLDGLRSLAGELSRDTGWCESFDGMVMYARAKGWLTSTGDAIRAHIERS